MILLKHELKQGLKSLAIWSVTVAFICAGCIWLYKSVEGQLAETAKLYANMGDMAKALGLDKVSLATLGGYFATEIALMFGLGAGMFAAMLGATALSKEEEGHTSEFLYTLPFSRMQIVLWKYAAIFVSLLLFNALIIGIEAIVIWQLNLDFAWEKFLTYHGLALFLQIELATICFLVSALSRKKQIGGALGLTLLFYVMDMMSRVVPDIDILKNWTPYNFASGVDIWSDSAINWTGLAIAFGLSILAFVGSLAIYQRKDLNG
ncbi:ABC transporter permease subunit [Streptococcus merionis]|uniref:Membrane protein n=1 Tax=Streptococcus merionis TaxID=400065 RepID=A0A239T0E3_9STRE|nr:ABC transporter permease subunit [Streptococcus merionis]SNU91157.1 membrane protein [Streptococcus merionis]